MVASAAIEAQRRQRRRGTAAGARKRNIACYGWAGGTNAPCPCVTNRTDGQGGVVSGEPIVVRVQGRGAVEAFSMTLARIVEEGAGARDGDAGMLATSIRAEAADLSALFAGLIDAVNDATDNLGMAAVSARVDGIVRSDGGYVAWGVIDLIRGRASRAPLELASPPMVREERSDTMIEAHVRRTGL